MSLDDEINAIYANADWSMIPEHMVEGLKLWVEYGVRPGAFMTAILEHDVYTAVFLADLENERNLSKWVKFLEWYMPGTCHGSEERVRDWEAMHGLRRKVL